MSTTTSKKKVALRQRRHRRVRAKVIGTSERPRLAVFRSAGHIYAQVIDDSVGKTLAAADDLKLDKKARDKAIKESEGRSAKVAVAYAVGKTVAELAKKAKVTSVVFDRGGFNYTGRVAALAQGARDGGLEF
jgi:large subunit ribosomal protein L18